MFSKSALLHFYKQVHATCFVQSVVHAGTAEQQQQHQQLERLLASAAKMLPAAQLGLAVAPPQTPGPPLALERSSAVGQVELIFCYGILLHLKFLYFAVKSHITCCKGMC